MSYNPFADKKFLTALADVFGFLLLYFAGKYAPASIADDIKTVYTALQPLVLLLIANMFMGDIAALRSGIQLAFFKPQKALPLNVKGSQPK